MKAGAATTDGDLSSAVGVAFDPILMGCNIDRDHGEAEIAVGRIVDEDLFALVR